MATQTAKEKAEQAAAEQSSSRGPDGQGGVPPEAVARHAFNADERAATREAAPVTVGELVFHRRRKNWAVTRELRTLLRKQERCSVRRNRVDKLIEALPADATDAEMDELEEQQEVLMDESDIAAYEIIALLLRGEDGEPLSLDHLKDKLDVQDAGALAQTLSTGGEPDPTPTTPST